MLELTATQRRTLRAQAHGLNPVVAIAQNGLTEAVLREIDHSLKAHELIKIRAYSDDREEREAWFATICESLQAAPVQHIGKLLVVWRPLPEGERRTPTRRPGAKAPRRTKRSFQA